jgi:hypothetical protein
VEGLTGCGGRTTGAARVLATFAPARPLRYVGHLKYTPPRAVVTDAP